MIVLENISKSYGEKILFKNLTYHFPQGEKIALIGPNGAGKTTLLKIMCREEEADSGTMTKSSQTIVGYLPQEPCAHPQPSILEEVLSGNKKIWQLKKKLDLALEEMTNNYNETNHEKYEKLEENFRQCEGYLQESKAKEILLGLGFSSSVIENSPLTLSGGWRMRVELAKIFLENPEFLILDEPTNHLDLPSLVWVEKFLQDFKGTLVFVSHDKSLLNRLATVTLHLHSGTVDYYKGNFDYFLQESEIRRQLVASRIEDIRRQEERIEKFVEKFKAKASKAKQAQSRLKTLAKLKALEDSLPDLSDDDAISFTLPTPVASGREVLSVENLSIGHKTPLFQKLSFKIERNQKIAIIGSNGIGKSTLLKTIAGVIPQLEGELNFGYRVTQAYYAQEQAEALDMNKSLLDNILHSCPDTTEREARSLLGSFLFRGDDVFKKAGVLSGGEKGRVGLCQLLLQKANFLLLDEPTNHLDMSSVEILAGALEEYEGTVLFVSHEREFINSVCNKILVLTQTGQFGLFDGKLEDYERLAEYQNFPNIFKPEKTQSSPLKKESTFVLEKTKVIDVKKKRQLLEKEKTVVDKTIETLTVEIKEIEDFFTKLSAADYKQSQDLHERYKELKNSLEKSEEKWFDLEEQLYHLS